MISVYEIRVDVNHYQYFLPQEESDWLDRLYMDCTLRSANWNPPEVYVLYPRLKAGDFYNFGSELLITSPRATEILRTHLEIAGELLPIFYQGQQFTLLNVTECINVLDGEKTEWRLDEETGVRIAPKKFVFHRNRFTESTLFKIPETNWGQIYVVEGLLDPEEEFRYVVESHGLEGLLFKEIWNDL
jgi:hypothetical protein